MMSLHSTRQDAERILRKLRQDVFNPDFQGQSDQNTIADGIQIYKDHIERTKSPKIAPEGYEVDCARRSE